MRGKTSEKPASPPQAAATPGKPAQPLNLQTAFVMDLCQTAIRNRTIEQEEDLLAALRIYRDYLTDRIAGHKPTTYPMSPAVDQLLDAWEAALNDHYARVKPTGSLLDPYTEMDTLFAEAFAEVFTGIMAVPPGERFGFLNE